ncbi:DUF262 domain-containing HNH endonuclease family protein [Pseudoalteromonas sp. BZB3]|uniref:DUF262 domain-containing HNH endonuclease family protein n=1 Tax=Pseudoalteromonas sp. BZB3 TaxID=3136670 RepID=UPI0032C41244
MELDKVFSSMPKSVYGVISDPGVCYYMPAYQRPYSWSSKNVKRFIEDIKSGIESLYNSEDAITFLGALLTVTDMHGDSVEPSHNGHLPNAVRLVIDGQQRLTTILLLCTRLYEKIALVKVKLEKLKTNYDSKLAKLESEGNCEDKTEFEAKSDALSEQVDRLNQTLSSLQFFMHDTNSQLDPNYRYYPKVIRGLVDCWGKKSKLATYNSPLASYLFKFNENIINSQGTNNKYKAFDLNDISSESYSVVLNNIKEIDKQLVTVERGYCWSEGEKVELKALEEPKYTKVLNFRVTQLIELFGDDLDVDIRRSLYLQLFTSYLLERVCVTFVAVTSENYAFDMFEALNTTGEPLTAYETFRPKVIEHLQKISNESTCEDLEEIDNYLNSITDSAQKQKLTQKVIDAFSYFQSGKSCGNHISNQRTFLLSSFKQQSTEESKAVYLKKLANTTDFLFKTWLKDGQADFQGIYLPIDEHQQVNVCMELLIDTGHDISRALLIYFYHHLRNEPENEELKVLFTRIVKMLAAFWVIRRSATNGTDGIDSVYKKIYSSVLQQSITPAEVNAKVKEIIKEDLKKKFITSNDKEGQLKEAWVSKAKTTPVYKKGKQIGICRMLLLSAMHDVTISAEDNARTIKAKLNSAPLLNYFRWSDFKAKGANQFTIEHIAPQTFIDNQWDSSLDENKLVDTIGNLVILPRGDNAEASNKDWHSKLELYKNLTHKNTSSNDKTYLNFIEPLTNVKGLWRQETVLQRAEDMLDHAWENLWPWIE